MGAAAAAAGGFDWARPPVRSDPRAPRVACSGCSVRIGRLRGRASLRNSLELFGFGAFRRRCFAGRDWVACAFCGDRTGWCLIVPFRRICLNHMELGSYSGEFCMMIPCVVRVAILMRANAAI